MRLRVLLQFVAIVITMVGGLGDGALKSRARQGGRHAMVVLNRIYTRTGDDGTTALGSGERRPKYDLRIAAYGTVDETNAAIGVVRLHRPIPRDSMRCWRRSRTICSISAPISRCPSARARPSACAMLPSQVERLERDIDT